MIQTITYDGVAIQVDVDDPDEHMQRHWMKGAFYECQRNGMLPYIFNHRDECPGVWYDVGAAIGNHTLFFAMICKREVVAIEPSESFKILQRQIDLNKLRKAVHPVHAALGDKPGWVIVEQKHPDQIGMREVRVLDVRETHDWRKVPLLTLDTVHIRIGKAVGLIKIDVEHYELPVLRGAAQTIDTYQPWVFVECSTIPELNTVHGYMKTHGYKLETGPDFEPIKFNPTPTYLWRKK